MNDFMQNCWYVGALSSLVTRTPLARRVLGRQVVLYRSEAGEAIALSNVCPHRFAPLHLGALHGDSIECAYHGLRFGRDGVCDFNPHGDHRVPRAARVASFPLLEKDGIVWIWMGDPAAADPAAAPDFSEFLGNGAMPVISGDFVVSAHYECILDNLLDLSHAPFLHPTTLANADSIQQLHVEMKQEGNTVWAYHYAPGTAPSPQFAPFFPEPIGDFHAHMQWDAPANLRLDVGITRLGEAESKGLYIHMLHLLSPIDMDHTLYTWFAARNFAEDPQVSAVMMQQIEHAFKTEDEPMVQAVWDNMPHADLMTLQPVLLPGDAAGVRARRILKQLVEQEKDAAAPAETAVTA